MLFRSNVWGSALVGAVLAMAACRAPAAWIPALLLAFSASFSAKLADTCGSEIGKRWGRHAILISNGRAVPPGTEGAISLEGTAASLLGSLLMTGGAALLGLISGLGAALLVAATGLVATLLESLIGATLQRRWGWLSNEMVNGLQTLIAAVLALLLTPLLSL